MRSRSAYSPGSACLRYEEQLSEALQRSLILLQCAHARTSESARILRVLRLLPFFRGGRRGPVAELVAALLQQAAEAREAGLSRSGAQVCRRQASFLVEPLMYRTPMPPILQEPRRMDVSPWTYGNSPATAVPEDGLLHLWYAAGHINRLQATRRP